MKPIQERPDLKERCFDRTSVRSRGTASDQASGDSDVNEAAHTHTPIRMRDLGAFGVCMYIHRFKGFFFNVIYCIIYI